MEVIIKNLDPYIKYAILNMIPIKHIIEIDSNNKIVNERTDINLIRCDYRPALLQYHLTIQCTYNPYAPYKYVGKFYVGGYDFKNTSPAQLTTDELNKALSMGCPSGVNVKAIGDNLSMSDFCPTKENQCTCDFNDLMKYGCKCGSFKREQESKGGIDLDEVVTDMLPDTSRIYNVGIPTSTDYSTLYQINVGLDMSDSTHYWECQHEIPNRKCGEKIKIRTSYPTYEKYLCEVIKIDKEIIHFKIIRPISLDD